MNRFLQHHRDAVRLDYSCFDRIILHGSIRCFQYPSCGGTVRWFLDDRRHTSCSRAAFYRLPSSRQTKLDRLYKKVDQAIAQLATHVGFAA